jgi:hypothetical protein
MGFQAKKNEKMGLSADFNEKKRVLGSYFLI